MGLLRYLLLFCIFNFVADCQNIQAAEANYFTRYVFQQGDTLEWKQKEFNDSHWQDIYHGLPKEAGRFWTRIHVKIPDNKHQTTVGKSVVVDHQQRAISLSILGSYNLFWDGQYLSNNGKVGNNAEEEVPGKIDHITPISASLWTTGEHVISLQISNFNSTKYLRTRYFEIKIGPIDRLLTSPIHKNFIPLMALGGLFIMAVYFLFLYLNHSRLSAYITFSLLCFAVSALLISETAKGIIGYTYDWHYIRLCLIQFFTFTVAFLLPLFFLFQFSILNKRFFLIPLFLALCSIVILVPGFSLANFILFLTTFFVSLVITFKAYIAKKEGALMAVLAVSSVTIINLVLPFAFQEQFFFLSFTLLILMVLSSLTQKMTAVEVEKEHALLVSAQLKIALLKKNIQPHFILNTLTSIEQWIEEEPKTAIRFIDALADEFRVLNHIAEKKLIPLSQEIELCDSHLKIMSYRKDKTFIIETRNTDPMLLLPPAIIHTLIENSLTHNQYSDRIVTFRLVQHTLTENPLESNTKYIKHSKWVKLALFTPMGINKNSDNLGTGSGTGLKYIKSRLFESFQEQWKLENNIIDGQWVTSIYIPNLMNEPQETEL